MTETTGNDEAWIVGIDIGGTGVRVARAGRDGQIVQVEEGGPANPVRVGPVSAMESLRTTLRRVFASRPAPVRIVAACVGMSGRSHPAAEGIVRAAFLEVGMPERRMLRDDGSIALDAAVGEGEGILVMSGTGSGACARGAAADRRVGGFGPILGDEGSAHAIGVAAVRAVTRASDGRGPATTLARMFQDQPDARRLPFLAAQDRIDFPGLFPAVDEAARSGDAVARAILEQAADDLADLVIGAANLARPSPGAPVATSGSVLGRSLIVRDALFASLDRRRSGFRPGPHVEHPVDGAVRRARLSLSRDAADFPQEW